jgi:alanyl aminopeptidase
MPNAEAAGYYRFALASDDLENLRRRGLGKLSARERVAFADSLQAAFASGAIDVKALLSVLGSLASDEERAVATAAMETLRFLKDHVLGEAERDALERYARKLYVGELRKLGMSAKRGEGGDSRLLRADLAWFLAEVARDPGTRRQLAAAGRADIEEGKSRVAEELRAVALSVAIEEGDDALFEAAYKKLIASQDPAERSRLLSGLSSVVDARSQRALELSLDPQLRTNEVIVPLRAQFRDLRTRDAAWAFFQQRYDALLERLGERRMGSTPGLATSLCSAEAVTQVQAFFEPRIAALVGGPRSLSEALEVISLCAASADHHREAARAFFAR